MYHRHNTPTVPQTEEQRLLELKLRIWSAVAVNLLNQRKDPHVIAGSKIESHGGRIGKALKDLRGLVSSTLPNSHYRVHDFETQNADLAVAPTFITTWQEHHDMVFIGRSIGRQSDFDLAGYKSVDNLGHKGAIYVYWHQDEYDFAVVKPERGEAESVYVYPRALRETRIKAMLRTDRKSVV